MLMSKKKILMVSNAFYPELSPRSFRATELAKELYFQGHEVTLISKFRDFDYSDFLKEYPISIKMWGKSIFPKVPDFKLWPFSKISRGISRLISVLFEYPAIEDTFQVNRTLKNESGYDLMISFAIPYTVHWGVAMARSAKNTIASTWVADCGDPYMFARLDTFNKPFYFKYLEINFCKKCDYISIPFIKMQSQFYPQFHDKIKEIPQGFNFEEIHLFDYKPNIYPVFIFAGSVIPGKRDLALFLDYLATLSIKFLFIVYTNQREWFDNYKRILGDKLDVRSYIDRLMLLYEMSKADFLVNVDTSLDSNENIEAVPSKLIDYALANRPILNLNSAHLDKDMVLEFLNRDYTRKRIINKSNFDIRKVTMKFLELINGK
jgi:hypothetical protein